ncbi:UNVERIFIED_CONTAM: bacteriocin immunity protein [Streptococcus canis]|nr:bacteriocin immunity protein [Streptococcus canis]
MEKNKDVTEWVKQIDTILNANDIRHNNALVKILLKARTAIEKGEQGALARLSNDISWYLVVNRYQTPKPIIDLAQQIAKEPHQERGKLAFLQSLALSLIHR